MEYRTYHRVENIQGSDIEHVLAIVKGIAGLLSTCVFKNKSTNTNSLSVNCTKSQWEQISATLGLAKNPNTNKFGYYLSKNYEA